MYTRSIDIELNPAGAIEIGKEVEVEIRISKHVGFIENVEILFNKQNEGVYKKAKLKYCKMEDDKVFFNGGFCLDKVGINYFCFSLIVNGEQEYIKQDPITKQACIATNTNWPYFSITVYEQGFSCPEWAKGAIVYHIFVDRFAKGKDTKIVPMKNRIVHENWNEEPYLKDLETGTIKNNDFFCGNIQGIIEHLDYIKSLGTDIIYLSPIMRSSSNHRYDTGDYENVDPFAGSNEDLQMLCKKAHNKGMRIMLDVVFNHTGNDSKYFNQFHNFNTVGAVDGQRSPYFNWYRKENNQFKYWWNFKTLPVLNTENPEVQEYILGEGAIIDKYFSWGIDAIRIDVADELSDEFLEKMRVAVQRNTKDVYILLEVWENGIRKQKGGKERRYLLGKAGTSAMNYPFTDAIIKYVRFGDENTLKSVVKEILMDYPDPVWSSMTNALSTHDIPRGFTTINGGGIEYGKYQWIWDIPENLRDSWFWKLEQDESVKKNYHNGKKQFKLAVMLQYFLPGSPCIFYGDEVGMMGYSNPFNRRTYPWGRRDKELLKFYRKMGKLRKQIRNMNFDLDFFIKTTIIRWYNEENEIFVILNPSNEDIIIPEYLLNKEVMYSAKSNLPILKAKEGVILR